MGYIRQLQSVHGLTYYGSCSPTKAIGPKIREYGSALEFSEGNSKCTVTELDWGRALVLLLTKNGLYACKAYSLR